MEKKTPGKQYCISQGSESQVTPPRRRMEEGATGSSCSPRLSARCQSVLSLAGRQAGEVIGCNFPCAASDASFHPLQEWHASHAHLCGFTTVWSVAVRTVVAALLDEVRLLMA